MGIIYPTLHRISLIVFLLGHTLDFDIILEFDILLGCVLDLGSLLDLIVGLGALILLGYVPDVDIITGHILDLNIITSPILHLNLFLHLSFNPGAGHAIVSGFSANLNLLWHETWCNSFSLVSPASLDNCSQQLLSGATTGGLSLARAPVQLGAPVIRLEPRSASSS